MKWTKYKTTIFAISTLLVISIGSTALAGNLSKKDKRDLYDNLVKELNQKQEQLNKNGRPNDATDTELRNKVNQVAELEKDVKTLDEAEKELLEALDTVKLGLNDNEATNNSPENMKFINKMRAKVAKIENDLKEKKKTPEKLLQELRDRSDVDN